jgi:hypothetical protein
MKQPTASTRAHQQASEMQTEGSYIALHANVDDAKGQTGVLRLLSEERLAAELGRSTATLRRWRRQGIGPPYISGVGRDIWYRIEAVEAWLISKEQSSLPNDPRPARRPSTAGDHRNQSGTAAAARSEPARERGPDPTALAICEARPAKPWKGSGGCRRLR